MKPFWWFLVKLLLVFVPLAILARTKQVYPHRRMVFVALAPALSSLVLLWRVELLGPLAVLDICVALLTVVDLLSLPRRRYFTAERQTGRVASLGKPHSVTLTINNLDTRDYDLLVRDDAPHELHPDPEDFVLPLSARSRGVLHYTLHSTRRGAFQLEQVHLRVLSRWRLWQRQLDYPVASTLHVYPDMKQLADYALLARKNRLSLLGLRRSRRIGTDNEFERLRDYTLDDNYKHIDWRSTARRQKLTVKDFQANQSQRLVFLIDCGRMMTNTSGGLSLLDHALNAMLMLSYVALSHGDSVGLLCFSDEIHHYIPPTSGLKQMNRLLHASFDRFPRLVESRYDEAFLYLGAHCRKRSLVILVSNLIDEVNSTQVERYLSTIAGRHLPLGVLLRDRRLFDAVDRRGDNEAAFYQAAAAADILNWRQQVLTDLLMRGVLALDVFPEQMTAGLVNRYLEIKARHLL